MRKLLFHFYIPSDYKTNMALKVHMWCLKRYSSVFTEAEFIVTKSSECGDDAVNDIVRDIMSLGFKNLSFKIERNTQFREAKTLYDYIHSTKNDYCTFFGHTKGVTNVNVPEFNEQSIVRWIFNLYYYNLDSEFIEGNIDNLASCEESCFSGAYLFQEDNEHYYYSGTFFWLNKIHVKRELSDVELSDRFYGETLPIRIKLETDGLPFDSPLGVYVHSSVSKCFRLRDMNSYYNDIYTDIVDSVCGVNTAYNRTSLFNKMYDEVKVPDIQIITIATNAYVSFIEEFLSSVKNFFPSMRKKITLLTNEDIHIDGLDIVRIPDMIYPTVNINKTYFVEQNIDSRCKYVFYFDIDTVFIEQDTNVWDFLINSMDGENIVLTAHPFYSLRDDLAWYGMPKASLIENFYSRNLTEKNEWSSCYIPSNEYTYINSAMFGGKSSVVSDFSKYITELEKQDLTRHFNDDVDKTYHIPQFIDENYFNKCVYEYQTNNDSRFSYEIGRFTRLGFEASNNIDMDSCIAIQKYDGDRKTNRR